jgi:hypothetical protein
MPRGIKRVEVTPLQVIEAGLVQIQKTPEPVVGKTPEKRTCHVGVMPRRVQVPPLGVVLSEEDLMGDRHGRNSRLFDIASKNGKNIIVEILAI